MFKKIINCPLFKGLSADEINSLLDKITYNIKKYDKGDIIAISGDKIISQRIVLEGKVKGEMVDFTGKTVKIEDIESPRLLAPAFLFGMNNTYPVNITASKPTEILAIPKDAFVSMLQKDARVLTNYLNIISSKAQFLSNKMKFLSFQSIKGKFAEYILNKLKHSDSTTIVLDKTIVELSEIFGVARPSLSRVIGDLNDEGVIETNGKEVKILDKSKLTKLLK